MTTTILVSRPTFPPTGQVIITVNYYRLVFFSDFRNSAFVAEEAVKAMYQNAPMTTIPEALASPARTWLSASAVQDAPMTTIPEALAAPARTWLSVSAVQDAPMTTIPEALAAPARTRLSARAV